MPARARRTSLYDRASVRALTLPSLPLGQMGVPYVIVKNKARLGVVTGKKTAAAVAIQDVDAADASALATLVSAAKANYSDKYAEVSKHWGGGVRGSKSLAMLRLRAKALGQDASTVSTHL